MSRSLEHRGNGDCNRDIPAFNLQDLNCPPSPPFLLVPHPLRPFVPSSPASQHLRSPPTGFLRRLPPCSSRPSCPSCFSLLLVWQQHRWISYRRSSSRSLNHHCAQCRALARASQPCRRPATTPPWSAMFEDSPSARARRTLSTQWVRDPWCSHSTGVLRLRLAESCAQCLAQDPCYTASPRNGPLIAVQRTHAPNPQCATGTDTMLRVQCFNSRA